MESFNGKLRDELLKRESFDTLLEAKVLIERWRQGSNTVRPHRAGLSEGPAPEARQPCAAASATPQRPHRAGLSEGESLTSQLVPHWGAGQGRAARIVATRRFAYCDRAAAPPRQP
ncbi:MAG: transposase [Planctomycetes bacterium]|nr:transposase [Planctomycetota bacterium]